MNKSERHDAIRERARDALRNLYHNATITYSRELYGRSEDYANSWVRDAAEQEIDYIASGGAYGSNYRKTLGADCNAGRYKSQAARDYYIRKGMRAMREERAKYAAWEDAGDYGKLYQWGRGGRTLAPDALIRTGGGSSFSIREDYADEMPIASVVELIRVLESFNRHVESWCSSVPEMWREHCAEEDAENLRARRKAAARKAKETRERNYWAARDVITV